MAQRRYANYWDWRSQQTGLVLPVDVWPAAIAEGEARAMDRMRLVTDDAAAIADAIALLHREGYDDVADELQAATSRVREAPRLTPQQREALGSLAEAATPGQLDAIEAALAALGEGE